MLSFERKGVAVLSEWTKENFKKLLSVSFGDKTNDEPSWR